MLLYYRLRAMQNSHSFTHFIVKNICNFSYRTCYKFSSNAIQPHLCIVGSGPAGFVVAQTLLKNHSTAKVDMYEKLPVPFGLIRYGVSPDHQDVKNCIHGYSKTAQSERFSFYGNVKIGEDVTLGELCKAYHAVILCTGAQGEQRLGIPGENLQNVFTSNKFVGWYNGVPEYQHLNIDLTGKTAVVVGVGNVALDTVRMLFKPMQQFRDTDITKEATEKLMKSNINTVHLVGRRGPLQMACTRKELAEITDLTNVTTFIEPNHFDNSVQAALKKKDLKKRKQQRLISYLQKVAVPQGFQSKEKQFYVHFLKSPSEVCTDNGKNISSIKFIKRNMEGEDVYNPTISNTAEIEEFDCDLLITCIGYRNTPLDNELIPFSNGKIVQEHGCINRKIGLYACGWCSHGPKGVLADSGNDSLLTGSTVLADLDTLLASKTNCTGSLHVLAQLKTAGIRVISWKEWENIDAHEVILGKMKGKVREKILSFHEMLKIVSK